MKRSKIPVIFLFLAAALAFAASASPAPAGPVDAAALKSTVVTPAADSPLSAGKNTIFCSAFQIAWNSLVNDILKGRVELSGEAPDYVGTLNSLVADKPLVKASACVGMAGYGGGGILEKINGALREKFGETAPVVSENLRPDDMIAYAYLLKDLKFASEFEALKEPLVFGEAKLDSFGIKSFDPSSEKHRELSRQVEILYYGRDGFAVRFNSRSADEEIVLSTLPAKGSLAAAYVALAEKIGREKARKLSARDTLKVPKIGFDIVNTYAGLVGKKLMNKGFEKYFITKALQGVKFSFNEKGASLASEARIVMTKNGSSHHAKPREMIARPPFFLYLKEKSAASPYLMVYFSDEELLVKK